MTRIEAVIFDCDGVIFDSHSANLAFYNKILERFNYPAVKAEEEDKVHLCHTATSTVVLKGLMADEHVSEALDYASKIDYREFIPYMIPEPHMTEVLHELAESYPLAVATNRGKSVVPVLEHFNLRDFFSVVVTSHDVERPKPAPDMLLLASEKLRVKAANCLFIGDSELDMQAARDAQIDFVGYGGNVAAAVTLDSHAELLPYLAGRR